MMFTHHFQCYEMMISLLKARSYITRCVILSKNVLFLIICVGACVWIFACGDSVHVGLETVLDLLKYLHIPVIHLTWVLRSKLGSSGKAAGLLTTDHLSSPRVCMFLSFVSSVIINTFSLLTILDPHKHHQCYSS